MVSGRGEHVMTGIFIAECDANVCLFELWTLIICLCLCDVTAGEYGSSSVNAYLEDDSTLSASISTRSGVYVVEVSVRT